MRQVTRELADFAATWHRRDIPAAVSERVHAHLIDTVAAVVVGSDRPWTGAVRSYALAESAAGRSSAAGVPTGLRPEFAATVNATAAHGFEIDDYALPALSHPGCVVVPAALAVAEEVGASTGEFHTAITIGYEVVLRLAAVTTPALTSDRGFHVTSVLGVMGAAAAAGRLWGLDTERMIHALGLAAAQASGTAEFTRSGGDVKRVHAGIAAAGGIRAAALASHGCTAPARSIEGERGYLRAFSVDADPAKVSADLGRTWLTDQLAVKVYCVCGGLQAPLAGVGAVLDSGVTAADIDHIHIGLDRATLAHVGSIGPRPDTLTSAQLSVHHAVATMIVLGGNDPHHYAELSGSAALQQQVHRLAERVSAYIDDRAERSFPHRLIAQVRVDSHTMPGTTVTAEAPGTPATPMTFDEIRSKFRRLTTPVLGAEFGADLLDTIDGPAGDTSTGIGPLLRRIQEVKGLS
ncbi:MmgE/PrpD family protein [Nocardia sp. NPDC050799]|uniref:MmgE/PrpD family protein n=1 Tax=Nocardia sp. NPDC050799 TaxID=3154842 RepID=UPI0033C08FEF